MARNNRLRRRQYGSFSFLRTLILCVFYMYLAASMTESERQNLVPDLITTNTYSGAPVVENDEPEFTLGNDVGEAVEDVVETENVQLLDEPVTTIDSVPNYIGANYMVLNGNTPHFDTSNLEPVSYEYYSDLDSLGRCGVTHACIGVDLMPVEERGAIDEVHPTGWKQEEYPGLIEEDNLYNRCHLIGYQLSGENANEKNLITGTRQMNVEGMLSFENMVADYVQETQNHVMYRVTPIFDGDNLLATGVQMEAYSIEDNGEGVCFNVFVYNVQEGIEIDYTDGSSRLADGVINLNYAPAVEQTEEPEAEVITRIAADETTEIAADETTRIVADETTGSMVWIPRTGEKYHSYADCSNMRNPKKVTISEAKERGFEKCKKCW